jgi:hypothetical protein
VGRGDGRVIRVIRDLTSFDHNSFVAHFQLSCIGHSSYQKIGLRGAPTRMRAALYLPIQTEVRRRRWAGAGPTKRGTIITSAPTHPAGTGSAAYFNRSEAEPVFDTERSRTYSDRI